VGRETFEAGIPVLGICYGMQLMTWRLGGQVVGKSEGREFGPAVVTIDDPEGSVLFRGLSGSERVWASHGDHIPAPRPAS
jgi:GMP synthase (glutamine-hydrolysing)